MKVVAGLSQSKKKTFVVQGAGGGSSNPGLAGTATGLHRHLVERTSFCVSMGCELNTRPVVLCTGSQTLPHFGC